MPERPTREWDRGANLDSGSGFVYFQRFMQRFAELDGAWKEPFDAQRPLDTPQGIALDRPQGDPGAPGAGGRGGGGGEERDSRRRALGATCK
ncbi:hypothetical protein ACPA9J_36205 [Pseudomonas aeruginosa]